MRVRLRGAWRTGGRERTGSRPSSGHSCWPSQERQAHPTAVISPAAILADNAHRPWPLPGSPWIMEQGWYNLLFAHWPVPNAQLRALVPHQLELDTFEGETWISLTPLYIHMRPRGCFAIGRRWFFPELNCRTYVTHRGRGGIYFFSLDARSLLAVLGARAFYRLPYFHADMRLSKAGAGFHFTSRRLAASSGSGASFDARYDPVSPPQFPDPGTLGHWLTERYCLYTVSAGLVWTADIHHARWPLQQVHIDTLQQNVSAAAGLTLTGPPSLTHFSAEQEVLIWPPRRAG